MIKIDRLAGTIDALSLRKRRAANADVDGCVEKRIALSADVSLNLADVEAAFPGARIVAQSLNVEDSHGVRIVCKRQALDVNVTLADPMGRVILGPVVMRGSAPILTLAEAGSVATLTIIVTGPLDAALTPALEAYYAADILVTITPAQPDLFAVPEEPAVRKPPRRVRQTEDVVIGDSTDPH